MSKDNEKLYQFDKQIAVIQQSQHNIQKSLQKMQEGMEKMAEHMSTMSVMDEKISNTHSTVIRSHKRTDTLEAEVKSIQKTLQNNAILLAERKGLDKFVYTVVGAIVTGAIATVYMFFQGRI